MVLSALVGCAGGCRCFSGPTWHWSSPCSFLLRMCENDTVQPLFACLPVNMHLRPDLPWMPAVETNERGAEAGQRRTTRARARFRFLSNARFRFRETEKPHKVTPFRWAPKPYDPIY